MKGMRIIFILTLAVGAILLFEGLATGVVITFTGDVGADFPAFTLYNDRNGVGDVGLPGTAPGGTAVGWDLDNVGLAYDHLSDTLFVGFNMGGGAISGDADGDGDPGTTATWLDDLLGTDLVDLAGTEAIDILIDVDQSCEFGSGQASDYEVVAGIPNDGDITNFAVSPFSQSPTAFTVPGAGHISPTTFSGSVFASPSASQPDLEFEIDNFCASILPACTPGVTPIAFAFRARAGSAADDGVGEDAIACTDVSYTPTAVTLKNVDTEVEFPSAWVALGLILVGVTGLLLTKSADRIKQPPVKMRRGAR